MTWGDWNLRLTPWRANSPRPQSLAVSPEHGDGALLAVLLAAENVQQGGLAGAVGADQAAQLGLVHGECHAVEHPEEPEALGYAGGIEDRGLVAGGIAGCGRDERGTLTAPGGAARHAQHAGDKPFGNERHRRHEDHPGGEGQYCSQTSARVAEAKLIANEPRTGPTIVARPPTRVHSTTLVARAKPKICGRRSRSGARRARPRCRPLRLRW